MRAVAADYFDMMKPRVQTLLLFTTITTMYVAGSPSIGLVALTCLGGALSAGGAGAINHWFDRDLDAGMVRTANRAGPGGGAAPRTPPCRRGMSPRATRWCAGSSWGSCRSRSWRRP